MRRRLEQQLVWTSKIKSTSQINAKNIWDYFEPVVDCPVRERVGGFSDGGKWVCKNQHLDNCRLYSFGSAGQTGFEKEMIEQHGCEAYTFDPNPRSNPVLEKGMCYFTVGMGPTPNEWKVNIDGKFYQTLSLLDIAKALNHTTVDILKIDIEGSEWYSVPYFLKQKEFENLGVSQIMIEFHYEVNNEAHAINLKNIFDSMQDRGYFAFSKEPNVLCGPLCTEYSFLHISKF